MSFSRMSAIGTKRILASALHMSANDPKRTFEVQSMNVRQGVIRWCDHLTLKYERVAKIMKIATISAAIKTIVRCSALAPVNRSAIATSTPGKI